METSALDPPAGYLAARLRPPRPARGVIARPRLDALLELVRSRALTVLKAPPGYGKTTVAQSWAEALSGAGARVAWLSLSAQDDHRERFFGALSAAVHRACAGEGASADERVVRELSIPLRHRIEWLVTELSADPDEFFLVLDDFHEITRSDIHQALSEQLRHSPDNLHLIVLSRSEPPLDLAALRAHDAVLELDASMLCFDLAETQQLLRRSQATPVDPQDAALLHEHTGGWIAALRAAMLGARIHGGAAQLLRRQPGMLRSVNAVFTALLDSLPPDALDFMQRVSVAERLCAPLAERLSGRRDALAVLQRLERHQVFINALDEAQQWFAFHRLFRDCVLRSAEQRDPALVPALHRLAAGWHAEQRHWPEAIGHALSAGDTALALGWIEQHAMAVVGAGDLLTLLSWERQLRAHLVESPLRLRLAFAWGLSLAMACDKALALLDGVEAQLDQAVGTGAARPGATEQAALRRECLALRSVVVCTTGDYELAASLAAQCDASAPLPPWVANALRNVAAAASLHTGQWQQLYGALPVLGESRAAPWGAACPGPAAGDQTAQAYRLSIRGLAELHQGHLEEAAALLEEGLALGAHSPPLAALPAPSLALLRYLQDRTAEAARLNAEHFEVNKRVAPIEGLYLAYLVAARLARQEGQAIQARHLLDEGESIGAARGWRRVQVTLLQEKLRLCLLDKRHAEAVACAGRIEALAASARSPLERRDFGRAARLVRAWCELADGRYTVALGVLQSLLDEAAAEGRRLDAIGLRTGLALAQLAEGATDRAAASLREAAQGVQATGALRALLDQPVPLASLLQAGLRARAELGAHPWLEPLLVRLQRSEGAVTAPRGNGSSAPLQALSPREHHILRLLADGQSNKEIARGLGIAPETVKTHVSKIFTKLGAQNRAQAAAMVVNA